MAKQFLTVTPDGEATTAAPTATHATTGEAAGAERAGGPLGALGVEWNLFVAQLVNFAIVFFVMWKYVYTPLMKTLDERTARIEKGLKDAEAAAGARKDADAERDRAILAARQE